MKDDKTEKDIAGTDSEQCQFSNLFFTIPRPANHLYHIFKDDEMKSICGKYGMLKIDEEQTARVKGKEMYKKGEDCKSCFKKAGLRV